VPEGEVISREMARRLGEISIAIKRQVALLIDRKGDVEYVVVGNDQGIFIPDLARFRSGAGRLKGLRCVHTHLHGEPLSQEDLMDLALLKLDLMLSINIDNRGIPRDLHYAHILPKNNLGQPWALEDLTDIGKLNIDFTEFIKELEAEFAKTGEGFGVGGQGRAVLVNVTTSSKENAEKSVQELTGLALACDLIVVDSIIQKKTKIDPRFLLGKGKLSELVVRTLQAGADLFIFDGELTPAQVRSLTNYTEMKIIDRSQLILDIFARRAVTKESKIQVELAQLRYLLPRLITKNTAMSRLTGGIGGRGPGETKLEINRRRARDRIALLNKELEVIRGHRKERRKKRKNKHIPIVSIVGYTNAGKSTLLNNLTGSHLIAEDRPFVTLDTTSRRLRLRNREVIITDTVGFIMDLPEEILDSFATTLEELNEADLLIHVADISNSGLEDQIESVSNILNSLNLKEIKTILALNKSDKLSKAQAGNISLKLNGIPISAINSSSLLELKREIESIIF